MEATCNAYTLSPESAKTKDSEEIMEKQCIRCERTFHLTKSGEYIMQRLAHSTGLVAPIMHFMSGRESKWALMGPTTTSFTTRSQQNSNETKVYALDCEMVFTGRGLEVARVTLVDCNNQLIYDHYVQPMVRSSTTTPDFLALLKEI
ncbi:unnamed protein product [Ceratitis capitata]|uniref:(Mediterranean fruit fly) hypothetical protein n=1 Tax=Ceratitis capitata TaxID=7213 RepID=A0A811UR02_CERCA|nr:unnamed protein product [Ceratitis capitata]